MKNTLILLTLSIITIALNGCDSREDYMFKNVELPVIGFSKTKSGEEKAFINDSVKLNSNIYSINYISNENIIVKGSTSLSYNVDALQVVKYENLKYITVNPLQVGAYTIDLYLKDVYENSSVAKLYLTVFNNLGPVAVMDYIIKNDNRVEINLERSFDNDAKFGGSITKYKFKIRSNYEFESDIPKVEVQFPSKGTFPVTLWAKDNNNEWSAPLNAFITL